MALTVEEFVMELNKTGIRNLESLQDTKWRIAREYGILLPYEVIPVIRDLEEHVDHRGLQDREIVALCLKAQIGTISNRELLLSKKISIGFYLLSGGSVSKELDEELLKELEYKIPEEDKVVAPPSQSDQPEYFCTNCGAETSMEEHETHRYLCFECAKNC